MAELWLICEGGSDAEVLSPVFSQVLRAEIAIEPATGISNLGAAAAFMRNQRGGTVAYLQDRDYHLRADAEALLVDGRPGFMLRRNAIENYLIEPHIILAAFSRLKKSLEQLPRPVPGWVAKLPSSIDAISEGLRECAKNLAPREAGRLAIWRLWEDLRTTAGGVQKRIPSPLVDASLVLPETCRKALIDEGQRLVKCAGETAGSQYLTSQAMADRYDALFQTVIGENYLATMQFLTDFCGFDIILEFRRWLEKAHGVNISRRILITELEAALPEVYSSNRLVFGTNDFLDLANGVRALAALPQLL